MDAGFLTEPDPDRAWDLFLEECLPTVERAARRAVSDEEEAADTSAEVLRRMHADWPRLLRRYEESRAKAAAGFRVWLAVVARNLAVDVLRARHGRAMTPRAVARLARWKQRVWKLVFVEGKQPSEAREELVAEGVFDGGLDRLAAAVHEIEAALPDAARSRRRPRVYPASADDGPGLAEPAAPGAEGPDSLSLRRAAHDALRENLAELGADERFLLRTYYLKGSTAAEVAPLVGLGSADQVYERVRALVRRLREAAERHGLGPEDVGVLADFDWVASLEAPGGEAAR